MGIRERGRAPVLGAVLLAGCGAGASGIAAVDGGVDGLVMGAGGASGGAIGEWANVTPPGISLDRMAFGGDNFGLQDVLVDPVRPGDLYAFVCHQGVYRSTDYGQTWTKVNTGMNGAKIDGGKPWGEGIDSNRARDPATPPTLYSAGSQNQFWRSKDGGVSWESFKLPEDGKARTQDAYDVDVNPYDGRHLVLAFHEESGMAESSDGGETWRAVPLAAGMSAGTSWYGFFIDTGAAASTRKTWLMVSQTTGGMAGTWRTGDAGATWTRVESNEHLHGAAQIYQRGGVVFMAGVYGTQGWGVYRSLDLGLTWKHLGGTGSANIVYGTDKFLYAQASPGVKQDGAQRAPQPGEDWSPWPLAIGDGPKRAAVTHDGVHAIVVAGDWSAGLWRYVEP